MAPNIPSKKKKKSAPTPVTVEDFLDCGVDEEDHGDRWIDSGDVPKAVRFYQKAFDFYARAIDMGQRDPQAIQFVQDAAYNVARMQYVVYSKVCKNGQLSRDMANYAVVPKALEEVAAAHSRALALVPQGKMPTDLLHTYGQVLAELGEDRENLDLMRQAVDSFGQVLTYQLSELQTMEESKQESVEESNTSGLATPDKATKKTENVSIAEGVTPSAAVETIVAFLDAINTELELCRDDNSPAITPQPAVAENVKSAIAGIHVVAREFFGLIGRFGVEGTEGCTFVSVASDLAAEAAITFAQTLSTCGDSLDLLLGIWSSEVISQESVPILEAVLGLRNNTITLPVTAQRFLAASDAFIGYAERPGVSAEIQWSAYSQASALLKRAWELASASSSIDVSVKLQVLVARGDVDFLRSRVPLPAAEKNREVLLRNAANMYASAINLPGAPMSLSSGGTAGQQLKREAKVKAMIVRGAPESEIQTVEGYQTILENSRAQGLI